MSTTPKTVRRRRHERGSTFAELMLATLIVSTTIVASTTSLAESAEVYHFFADGPHEALMLAQEVHEAAEMLPWDAEVGTPGNFGPDVVTLWDLDGTEFSPPRSADYDVVVSHNSWTQSVSIHVVDLHDPSVHVDPDTFEGDTLAELHVRIYQGELLVDEFRWWLGDPAKEK
jgi:hypothetical protein